ncbi:MAG: hypothetical protein K6E18_05705 [Lachnospiraceae bacterium]|nr:hypothetical protein [Lachnospiraceae bacterium]
MIGTVLDGNDAPDIYVNYSWMYGREQYQSSIDHAEDLSFNSMYAAFEKVPKSRVLSPEELGLTDDALIQVRQAVYGVGTGSMTIDEAVSAYGTFTQ